ncbi:MAG: transglutaminase domain-containing protein, partial [Muribaculaceae bacterium]|nr:transglutaminase domain-containing protein [Muribaculaceae bacterium]
PFPYENLRQKNIKLDGSNHPVTFSDPSCKHHTVYMEATTVKGLPTHFEYSFSYDVAERHIAQQDLLAMLEPYKITEDYIKYTSTEPPHIILSDKMKLMAKEIVGSETNSVLQASMIYDWIVSQFPWAGAREYSTLTNIPEYVLLNKHGDCGQVALLYITLVRSLGIPARWESGWMLHPDEINWHDWAETYFEGIGWVPTDVSFGRSAYGTPLADYYKTGIDVYRMASNEAVGQKLSPEKTYIRSETVDFQPGEVEWRGGNLYYNKWKSHLEVDGITPVNNLIKR